MQGSIERPHVCYASDGSVQACEVPGSSTYTGSQGFSFGDPTTVADDCVALSDLFNGTAGLNLGPMPAEFPVADPVCDSTTLYLSGSPVPGVDLIGDQQLRGGMASSGSASLIRVSMR